MEEIVSTTEPQPTTPSVVRREDPIQWTPSVVIRDGDAQTRGIVLRALNPDNRGDAKKVVQLFTSYYDAGYPFDGVFDAEYWYRLTAQNQGSLISLAADDEGEFIGHLALHVDGSRKEVEVVFPAIHPSYAESLLDLTRLYWRKLEHLAEVQSWISVSQWTLVSETSLQVISSKYFDSFEMALVPELAVVASSANRGSGNDAAMLMSHFFSSWNEPLRYLSPPVRHAEKIQELYSALKLPRVFTAPQQRSQSTDVAPGSAKESFTLSQRFGVREISVYVGADEGVTEGVNRASEAIREAQSSGFRPLLRVRLDDANCPILTDKVEQMGFKFCGILPHTSGGDYMLYSQFDRNAVRGLSVSTPRGRSLQSYIARKD